MGRGVGIESHSMINMAFAGRSDRCGFENFEGRCRGTGSRMYIQSDLEYARCAAKAF